MERCRWCCDNDMALKYHDEEWGVPLHDDRKQFEYLMMEVMQCGLNWNMMLKKRKVFKRCFDDFDYDKIALFDERDIERIMAVEGMIKSPRKIKAVIENAKNFKKIIEEFGTFDKYIWSFSDNKTLVYIKHQKEGMEARNELSDIVSKDLKKRGFKYLGSITVFSHLQACGIINDHEPVCYRYKELLEISDVKYIED